MSFLKTERNGSPLDSITHQQARWWDHIGVWFPNARIVELTPDLAKEWWEYNTSNRKIKPQVVSKYKMDMLANRWAFNCEPIIISKDRVVIDGQHRIAAVIESGQTIKVLVVFDAEPESFETIDCGSKRTASDVLGIKNQVNTTLLSGAARTIIGYLRGTMSAKLISDSHVVQFVMSNPTLAGYTQNAKSIQHLCPASALVAAQFLTHPTTAVREDWAPIDPQKRLEMWHHFWDGVIKGEMLEKGEPEFALREKFYLLRFGSVDGGKLKNRGILGVKADALTFLYCIAVAWNAKVDGFPLKLIKLRDGYRNNFPRFK